MWEPGLPAIAVCQKYTFAWQTAIAGKPGSHRFTLGFCSQVFRLWKCASMRCASAACPLNNSNAFTA